MGKLPKNNKSKKRSQRRLDKPHCELARKAYLKEVATERNISECLRVGGLSKREAEYAVSSCVIEAVERTKRSFIPD